MRTLARIGGALASVIALTAAAQHIDILEGTPPTGIYVETTYDANPGRAECDWYAPAADLVTSLQSPHGEFATDCTIDIRIKGTLNREGARRFVALVAELGKTPLKPAAIVLDSRGGDTDAALAIARAIRGSAVFRRVSGGVATRLDTTPSTVCFSGCIVIFAAGYRRSVEFEIFGDPALPSRLGIHGPGQFNRDENRYDTSHGNAEIQRIRRALKAYFAEVGVSPALVDDMFDVPFEDIRLLDEASVRRYGLLGGQD